MNRTFFVHIAPPIIQPASGSDTQLAIQGENYSIEFSIAGDCPLVETANIKWMYKQNPTSVSVPWPPPFESQPQNQQHYLSSDRKSLTIIDVEISDGGFYTLIANNSAGERNSTILLLVNGEIKYLKL